MGSVYRFRHKDAVQQPKVVSANRGVGRSELLQITNDVGEYSYDIEGRSRLYRCLELTAI